MNRHYIHKPKTKSPHIKITFFHSTKNHSLYHIENKIFSSFKSTYSSKTNFYNIKIINELISNDHTHIVSLFKDTQISSNLSEFIESFHSLNTSRETIPKLCEYYENCSMIFPNYISLPESRFMYKNIQRKQRLIDAEQEREMLEEEKANNSNYTTEEPTVFDAKAIESILNTTNTSAIRALMGMKRKDDRNIGQSIENFINVINKEDDNDKGKGNNEVKMKENINCLNGSSNIFNIRCKLQFCIIKGRNRRKAIKREMQRNERNERTVGCISNNSNNINSNIINREIKGRKAKRNLKHNNSTNTQKGLINYLLSTKNDYVINVNNKFKEFKHKTKKSSLRQKKITKSTSNEKKTLSCSSFNRKSDTFINMISSFIKQNGNNSVYKYKTKSKDFERTTTQNEIIHSQFKVPISSKGKEIITLRPELKKLLYPKVKKIKTPTSLSYKKRFTSSSLGNAVSYNNKEHSNDKSNIRQKEKIFSKSKSKDKGESITKMSAKPTKPTIGNYIRNKHHNRNARLSLTEFLTKANTSTPIDLKSYRTKRNSHCKEKIINKNSLSRKMSNDIKYQGSNSINNNNNNFINKKKHSHLVLHNRKEMNIKGIKIKCFENIIYNYKSYIHSRANSDRISYSNVFNTNNTTTSPTNSRRKKFFNRIINKHNHP